MRLGLQFSCVMVDDMEGAAPYSEHAVEGLNHTRISGMVHWSPAFGVKYFFAD